MTSASTPAARGKKSSWLRSAWAVFAGVLANAVIAVPIDLALHALGVYPAEREPLTQAQSALAFSYRLVAAIAGGYLTARLAPDNPRRHVLILGCTGIVLASAGAAAMWGFGPAWYPLALIAISLPASLLGGSLARKS